MGAEGRDKFLGDAWWSTYWLKWLCVHKIVLSHSSKNDERDSKYMIDKYMIDTRQMIDWLMIDRWYISNREACR